MTSTSKPFGLYALTLGAFAIGTTEFVPMGLLPQIASDLHVSIPKTGFLVTGYALGVAIGAPLLTVALGRLKRKAALMILLAFFIAGNLLAGIAGTYNVLLVARILAALCHGTFFGIGALTAEALVPPSRSASAIATMFVGLTLATVLGVPFGAFVGSNLGWHVPFLLISLVGILALAGVALLVPQVTALGSDSASQLRSIVSRPVLLALTTTTLGFGGVFTVFTYIAPLLERVSGFSANAVSALLVLFGLGTTAGNIVAGRYADRSLPATLVVTLAALAVVLAASTLMWSVPMLAVVATAAIGFFGFATVTPLQLLVIRAARSAPSLASSANISAFNIGNALGAALGGFVIAAGFAIPSLGVAAAIVTVLGVLSGLLAIRYLRGADVAQVARASAVILGTVAIGALMGTRANAQDIPVPARVVFTTVNAQPGAAQQAELHGALLFYAGWNTGKAIYFRRALAPGFIDHTLPLGRPQGPAGPIFASAQFRKVVPNLRCAVEDVLIAGDEVTVRQRYTGTSTRGKPIDFAAIDILRMRNGVIIADWHLEDYATLNRQLK